MPIHGLRPSTRAVNPAHFSIESVIRPNILSLHPYRCARDDYQSGILLDANENALGHSLKEGGDLNRYPDPSHDSIKARVAELRGLGGADKTDHVFLGVGSDEIIDLLMRVCVSPGPQGDSILITPPTYGMYAVCAQVNDVRVVKVPLELIGENGEEGGERGRFSVREEEILRVCSADKSIKLVFLCSPGNPTGTSISLSSIRRILSSPTFTGILVIDEAYVDFATSSAVGLVDEFSNLVVLQTLSKSFGLAAIRLGIAIAQPPIIQVLTNTKAPYNIGTPTASLALSALSPEGVQGMKDKVGTLIKNRSKLLDLLRPIQERGDLGASIGANEANFVVVPVLSAATGRPDNTRAIKVYKSLAEENGVVVRYRGGEVGCEGCLRITVGSEDEIREVARKLGEVLEKID